MQLVCFRYVHGAVFICRSVADGVGATAVDTFGSDLWGGAKISAMIKSTIGTGIQYSFAVRSKVAKFLAFETSPRRSYGFVNHGKFTFNIEPMLDDFIGSFFGG